MTPPRIEQSTKEERLAFVLNQWKCLSNCEICGKCSMLRGRNEEMLYADYIDGKRSYMDIIPDPYKAPIRHYKDSDTHIPVF
jgi:hypothetical protein